MKDMITKGLTINHTKGGKMCGMASFSTNTLSNEFCNNMRKCKDSICSKCFAGRQLKMQPSTNDKLMRNEWIKWQVVEKKDVPFLNVALFRFEAFGELETLMQLENYMMIAKHNKHAVFTLFTKRIDLLNKFTGKKPSNFIIIQSSPILNKQNEEIHKLADGIFTVYTKDYVKENDIKINCGELKCRDCKICYTKTRKFKVINELVK